jgi:DNA-binding transcriptional regulator PaaX
MDSTFLVFGYLANAMTISPAGTMPKVTTAAEKHGATTGKTFRKGIVFA